ncbi:hypothetical protein DUNSADRAFT_2948 [Dunaliella salina]|uniref:Uncharacterized protein n=1 Tax=Dunaliella salina TaxID=3046 RepID=A0ABQ7GUX1_DUNSA|nr:hypothetical protein DUNSADRAFT_2948 [Dunaliella salina]|eukprot:KAF5838412.1 hypothetical protein DUNSADRAFT_2948 [Dunaliella salina]
MISSVDMQPVCSTDFWHVALSPERKDYESPYRHRGSSQASSVTQFSAKASHGGPLHIPHLEHRVLHLTNQNHPEAGLQSGDVVKFVQQGQTCCVTEACLDELTGEHAAQYVLDLAERRSPAGKAPAAGAKGEAAEGAEQELHRHCLLEVVRQDAFLGFRAPAASWRYMQPRRKAPHRLVFFNLNLGIWEQWEVASGDPWSQPWTSMHLVLRSRRLPNITLDLQVHRVGRYGASPIAHAPPSRGLAAGGSDAADHISNSSASPPHTTGSRRSTAGSPATGAAGVAGGGGGVRKMLQFANELGEDEHLRRISSMLVQEWVRFVDVEKALRAEVEEQVVALVEEMAQLKMDTIGQVRCQAWLE